MSSESLNNDKDVQSSSKDTKSPTSPANTMECLKCDKLYKLPDRDDYLAHLFLEHRLIIADVDDISLLPEYLTHWLGKFKTKDLEEYCTTMLLDQLPDGTPAKNERYFLLSDILPEDYELRRKLHQQNLEKALAQHQFERTDRSFSKECLYCRDVISGLRSEFLEHLFSKHFLQLGKPENLVYVDELLQQVQHNLEQLVCLYCEKVFKDRVTLKEHMRKKAHKRINPSNKAYDKYFLINYKGEKNKSQHNNNHASSRQKNMFAKRNARQKLSETASADDTASIDFEQRHRELRGGSDSADDSDWSDWDGEGSTELMCLFCSLKDVSFVNLKQHLLSQHDFEFDSLLNKLNFYQRIKVINYIRRQIRLKRCVSCDARHESEELLLQHLSVEKHFGIGTQKQWDKPEFFFPTYEDDGLLCLLDNNDEQDGETSGLEDTLVKIISEDTVAQINKDAERLSLENFSFL